MGQPRREYIDGPKYVCSHCKCVPLPPAKHLGWSEVPVSATVWPDAPFGANKLDAAVHPSFHTCKCGVLKRLAVHLAKPALAKSQTADVAGFSALVWEGFMGTQQPAVLLRAVLNVERAPEVRTERLTSGVFDLASVRCRLCQAELGWRYLSAASQDQCYKVGCELVLRSALTLVLPPPDGADDADADAACDAGLGPLGGGAPRERARGGRALDPALDPAVGDARRLLAQSMPVVVESAAAAVAAMRRRQEAAGRAAGARAGAAARGPVRGPRDPRVGGPVGPGQGARAGASGSAEARLRHTLELQAAAASHSVPNIGVWPPRRA